ncbi:MAG: glycine--tRNA ligase [Marine Group III euryarchaeote CG-Epi3]|uniref:glycine--tRNA ligase n=1 Tax=Marine Group III euryarchaeote CG-Epi3 TaxID=1888997 RepID=A0A1J5UA72_9ARCH|nr:MAG: glycine--tRNA ligase [Marine Group III euryarchaeote CG-Epi3]
MDFQKIIAVATKRGIFQPAFDAYGGLAGFLDYGPVGVRMRRRILEVWRKHYVINAGCLELDGALVGPEALFQASGHLGEFDDALVDCEECGKQFRADHLVDGGEEMSRADLAKAIANISCPNCSSTLSEMRAFNLMFATSVGAGKGTPGYLRPETAQSIFLAFPWLLRQNRGKLPFAGAQIGRSFRNEISPRQGPIRMREFTQMEVEHFFLPSDEPELPSELENTKITLLPAHGKENQTTVGEAFDSKIINSSLVATHLARAQNFLISIGVPNEKLRFRQHGSNEMAHYSSDCWDGEINTSLGWIEIVGVAHRGCYDLSAHGNASSKEFRVPIPGTEQETEVWKPDIGKLGKEFRGNAKLILEAIKDIELKPGITVNIDGESIGLDESYMALKMERKSQMVYPNVVEPSFGLDRILYCLLESSWNVEGEREWISLPQDTSPYDLLVAPLMTKDKLDEKAHEIMKSAIDVGVDAYYDEAGSIGRRYARADEIGIFYSMTIDHQTLEDGTVTLRERDSKNQSRVPIKDALDRVRR